MTDDDALIARLIVKSTPLEREAAARIAALTAECESSAHLLVLASDRATKAEAALAAETERCAKVCEQTSAYDPYTETLATACAAAIRAGEKK